MTELPVRFKERMKELLGDEYEALEASYDSERVQGLRFNSLKAWGGTEDGWEEQGVRDLAQKVSDRAGFSLKKIPWVKEGFYYDGSHRPGKHPYHEAGLYYIQEPSAMAVVELLDPQPGDRVLDLCAAPGGKSSHIASRLKGQGFLLSNEIHPARARILSQNMERMGVYNCVVSNQEPGQLAPHFTEYFHGIVVDAPCSGEGMFRKDEAARAQWSEEHVDMCAARQREILDSAAAMLRPGGRMVYSTCTFAPEENEGAILGFLERHEEFCVESVAAYEGFTEGKPQWIGWKDREKAGERSDQEGVASEQTSELVKQHHLEETFRIMPHKLEGEGHYMAVLKKREPGDKACCRARFKEAVYLDSRKRDGIFKDYEAFLKDTLVRPEQFLERDEYVLFGDQLYLLPPEMPDMKGLKIIRPGLHMGALKKNRFEPSHGLALVLRQEDVKRWAELPSHEKEVIRYLKGETLSADEVRAEGDRKGWGLVLTDGLSLGWCKFAGGMLKNHYPKGLRRM